MAEAAACRRGNDIGARSYGSIASILQHGLDRAYAQEKVADGAPINQPLDVCWNVFGPRRQHRTLTRSRANPLPLLDVDDAPAGGSNPVTGRPAVILVANSCLSVYSPIRIISAVGYPP
jgi:hypothetical protein